MTAINFPDSPSNGDTHVVGGVTYTYDSTETKWKTTINSNAFLPLSGGTVSGNIVLGGEIQHDGDTDTKIHFDTDTIKLDTGGTTRATVDSSGRLLVGTSSTSIGSTMVLSGRSDNATGGSRLYLSAGTTSPANSSQLGGIYFSDDNENAGAQIESVRDGGTWTSGSSQPTRLTFATTADGASSPTERMRITSTGDLRFNSGYGSAATAYGVRAWVNFNGTGTPSIRGSANVSSITDFNTGRFRVNFSTSMPDANYSAVTSTGDSNSLYPRIHGVGNSETGNLPTTTYCPLISLYHGNNGFEDLTHNMLAILR